MEPAFDEELYTAGVAGSDYEAPVIRSLATPEGIVRNIAPMRWGFPAPPLRRAHLA